MSNDILNCLDENEKLLIMIRTQNPDDFIRILNNYLNRVGHINFTKGIFSHSISIQDNDPRLKIYDLPIKFNEVRQISVSSKLHNPYVYKVYVYIYERDSSIIYTAIVTKTHYDDYPVHHPKRKDGTEPEIDWKYNKNNPLKYKTGDNYIPSEPGYHIFALINPDGAMMMRIALVDGKPTAFRNGRPIYHEDFKGFQQWYGPAPYEFLRYEAACWNLDSDRYTFYYEDDILALPE